MEHSDQGDANKVVLDKEGITKSCARAHEHRRHKVGHEWISETGARECRVLRRKVLTKSETCDHAQVKREVAIVVQHSRVNPTRLFKHRPREYQPHADRHRCIEKKIDERPAIRPGGGATDCSSCFVKVLIDLSAEPRAPQEQYRHGQYNRTPN